MTTRQPLSAASTNRPHVKEKKTEPDNLKLQTALDDAANQRRKRAEAEGVAQGARKDAIAAEEMAARFKKELEKAKASIARRDEDLASLRKKAGDGLEAQLQELVERHKTSKSKWKSEIDDLQKANADLANQLRDEQKKHGLSTEQRRATALMEAENAVLKKEIDRLRATLKSTRSEEGRWGKERASLFHELESLKHQVFAGEKVKEERDVLEDLLNAATLTFATSSRAWKEQLRDVKEELILERAEKMCWKTRTSELRMRVKGMMRDSRILQRRFDLVLAENAILHENLRFHCCPITLPPPPQSETVLPLPSLDITQEFQITFNHLDLLSDHLQYVKSDNDVLFASLKSTTVSLEKAEQVESSLRASYAELQAQHSALIQEHEPCAARELSLKEELTRVQEAEKGVREQMTEMHGKVSRAEQRAKEDREMLRRANDSAMRSKAAETALEEEVQRLKDALLQAEQYRELYEDLDERYRILESREAMALDEAEKLGHQNARLIGHVNGDQRISYVDSVRREMALVKAELAATRTMLNDANDRIKDLSREVEAYKSVEPMGIGQRTKVVRRQPEGSRLVMSTNRSVSGPSGWR
ncbi:hypothetical protein TREMEDRAFT_58315 [Tremella mesenterica DSM 1558]|uniref:uncharacterized protein n=1 Tax=Tremella mesenterica (strain ATCC 24925 / CBS 8224 / DSM 1558 / NBRC 9311 / NRRL Y-6157 / RJB 2259-6 / UBC 559-6) TaxID=578456 RepID=UPI0003F4A23B|nr:uncharacterized protein TREMEDRAFT_58315 [Tremella mesenterica DSM 1558]EIW72160.1 hypothetical protein TREMEDRAFT_58315 [Tremella mesenterica DSM 1558]